MLTGLQWLVPTGRGCATPAIQRKLMPEQGRSVNGFPYQRDITNQDLTLEPRM